MEYMILIHSDETYCNAGARAPRISTQMMAGWMAYNQRLIDGGHWIAAANLQPTGTATTVRKSFDAPHTSHRWAVRRDEGAARRLLPDQGRRPGRGTGPGRGDPGAGRRHRSPTRRVPAGCRLTDSATAGGTDD